MIKLTKTPDLEQNPMKVEPHNISWPSRAELSQIPSFTQHFPNLLEIIKKVPSSINFGAKSVEIYKESRGEFRERYLDSIISTVIPEWKSLQKQETGFVNDHIMLVFWLFTMDENIQNLCGEDINLLYWISILHDIVKLRPPLVQTRDPMHPFRSAASALKVISRVLGLQCYPHFIREINSLSLLFLSSSQVLYRRSYSMENKKIYTEIYKESLDLRKCGVLFGKLDALFPKYTFANDLIKLISLHQSLPAIPKYPCFDQLTSEQIVEYFDEHRLWLMYLIMINDSVSYSQFGYLRKDIPVNVSEFWKSYHKIKLLFE